MSVCSARTRALVVAGTLTLGLVPVVAFAPAASAAPAATKLTVKTNYTTFVAGKKLIVAAHLNVAGATVKFYEKVPGLKTKLVYTDTTDGNGNAGAQGEAVYNATYTVKYAGSSKYAAASGSASVKVKVKMITSLRGGFTTKAPYRVYHAGKKGVFVVGVAPKKAGNRVTYTLQIKKGSAWKTLDTRKYTLDKDSVAGGTFTGTKGNKYRVKATWAGSSTNLAGSTVWRYAAFVA